MTTDLSWSPPAQVGFTTDRQVDIWRIRLDLPIHVIQQLQKSLPVEEAARAAQFYFPADQNRFIVSHASLRQILARYLHGEPSQLSFSVNAYRKPYLDGRGLEFNLSHSGDLALIAVTPIRKVGIDVEQMRPGFGTEDISRRFFSPSEVAELQSLPVEQREPAFFLCWTRKEAYIKAQGMGLTLPLDSFDVSLSPGEPALLRATRPDPGEAARWTLITLEVGPGYAAAVAVEGQNVGLQLWDWKPD
jgi:4'-phosphopantetheinyl transferase